MKTESMIDINHLTIDRSKRSNSAKQQNQIVFLVSGLILVTCCAYLFVDYKRVNTFFTSSSLIQYLAQQATEQPSDGYLNQSNDFVIDNSKSKLLVGPLAEKTKLVALKVKEQSVLDASGHIIARRVATVSSRVTGKIEALNIEEGQKVLKTQILAELDDQQARISYQLAQAELSAKIANYEQLNSALDQQRKRLIRDKSLIEQKLISQQHFDDSEFKLAQLTAQVRNKQALVSLSHQRVALAKYELEQHQIRAPFDGVVISKNAQVGELISSGNSGGGSIRTGVGTIVDMNSLEIEVEVGESYINRIFVGQKAVAKLDAYPKWSIASEVLAVIPTANRQKASIKVRVKLLDVDHRILPDMGVKVSFYQKNIKQLT